MNLIIDLCESSLSKYEFVDPVQALVPDAQVRHFSEVTAQDFESAGKIIICGTAMQDYNKGYEMLFPFIRQSTSPILGICAGMQACAMAFGGMLTQQRDIGMLEVESVKPSKILSSKFSAYNVHNFNVKSHPGFEIIAVSDGKVQAIKHVEREIYGVIFHPEVRNPDIISAFINL